MFIFREKAREKNYFEATSHAVDVALRSGTSRTGDVPENKVLSSDINIKINTGWYIPVVPAVPFSCMMVIPVIVSAFSAT